MKRIILCVIIGLTSIFVKAENDTCYINSISDSCIINDTASVIVNSESSMEIVKPNPDLKTKPFVKIKNKVDLLKKSKPAGFFDDAWDWFTDLFKPVHGYYEEDGQRNDGPYFLFDRKEDGPSYTRHQMEEVRLKIKVSSSTEQIIYIDIFALAGTTTIDNCSGVWIPNPGDGSTLLYNSL